MIVCHTSPHTHASPQPHLSLCGWQAGGPGTVPFSVHMHVHGWVSELCWPLLPPQSDWLPQPRCSGEGAARAPGFHWAWASWGSSCSASGLWGVGVVRRGGGSNPRHATLFGRYLNRPWAKSDNFWVPVKLSSSSTRTRGALVQIGFFQSEKSRQSSSPAQAGPWAKLDSLTCPSSRAAAG